MEEENQGLVRQKLRVINAKTYKKVIPPIFNTLMVIIFLCLIAFMLTMVIQQSKIVSHEQSFLQKQQLKRPLIDTNIYQYLTLSNGLQVMLIQNNDAQISQVALSVQAGSFQEPETYEGLAHLLEHMLFVGSHTYPDPGYFNNFVSNNGGTNNAYTDNYETNYYFTISNNGLKQGLDVFSHFFIDPLLDQKMVEKEVNAVNNEYEIITSSDEWKIEGLLKILSDCSHPFNWFNIGNLNTLLKGEISEKLKQFFDNYYSANLMTLVIESSLPIDEQKELIHSFEQITNHDISQPSCLSFGQPIKEGTQLLKYQLNSENKRIQITHQLSDVEQSYHTKSIEFINNLIRSQHGLKEVLISKKLIISLDTDVLYNDHNGCFSIFVIDMQVNDVDDYEQILQTVYSYYYFLITSLFDDQGDTLNDNDKLRRLYQDYKRSASLKFNFNENIIGDIQEIAHNLNFYGYHNVLSRKYLFEDYDPELIYFYLTDFLDIDNLNVFLGDNHLDHQDVQYDKVNKINYVILEMTDAVISKIQSYDEVEQPKFKLPLPSKYHPDDLKMKSFCKPYDEKEKSDPYEQLNNDEQDVFLEKSQEMVFYTVEECKEHEKEYEFIYPLPEFIHRSPTGKLWWKLDRTYQLPSVFMGMKIDKINFQSTLIQQTQLQIFQAYTTNLLKKSMEEAFNDNYKLKFESSPNNIIFNIYGWSDGFSIFVQDVLTQFTHTNIDEQIFQQTIQNLVAEINEEINAPFYEQVRNHYLWNTLKYGYFGPDKVLGQLKTITMKDYTQFHSQLFKGTNFQMYLTGNILREEALQLYKQVEKKLFGKSKHLDYTPNYQKILKLSSNFIIPYVADSNDNNGATLNYYIFGNRNRRQFAIMNLLKGTFDSLAFNYLRTELQLGYVVSAKFMPLECLDGAAILVQGSALSPYLVNQKIEDFLNLFYQNVERMTDFDLQELKKAAISQLRQKEKTLMEKGEAYWEHIQNNDFIFEEKDITIDEIDLLTKENVLHFMHNALKKSQKVSIQLYGKHILKGLSLEEYLKNQSEIKSFSDQKEKVTDSEKIKVGAMLYQCSFKLGGI